MNIAMILFWILCIISIFGYTLLLVSSTNYKFFTSFLIVVLSIVNALFWGTFLNFYIIQILIILVGSLLFLYQLRLVYKFKNEILFTSSLLIWFGFMSFISYPFAWDEFFWILFDMHLSVFSSYWNIDSPILISHARYMPGSALLHNFFGIKGLYNVCSSFFANLVLISSISLWIIEDIKEKFKLKYLFLIYLSLGAMSLGLYTLYVDGILGLLMGVSLISGVKLLNDKYSSLPVLNLALSSCILFKETGIIALFTFFFVYFIHLLTSKNTYRLKVFMSLFYPFLIIIAWNFYLKKSKIPKLDYYRIFTDFSDNMVVHYKATLVDFSTKLLFDYQIVEIWILTLILISIFIFQKKTIISYFYLIIFVGFFMVLHLLSWMFLINPDGKGGSGVTDMHRYFGSLMILLFITILNYLPKNKNKFQNISFIISIFIISLFPLGSRFFEKSWNIGIFNTITPDLVQVKKINQIIEEINLNFPKRALDYCKNHPSSKMWIIYQNSQGLEKLIAGHLIFPCQLSSGRFSLGEKYYENDIWTDNLSTSEFINFAKDNSLMLTLKIDNNFISKYKNIFVGTVQNRNFYIFDPNLQKFKSF